LSESAVAVFESRIRPLRTMRRWAKRARVLLPVPS
jgi:hypothetical protein